MFAISTKITYGLSAMLELAEQYGQGVVQINEIVRRKNIPENYLIQILNRLVKTGLVKSYRGNKGGYALVKQPEEISVLRIVESLEGELNFEKPATNFLLKRITERVEAFVRKEFDIPLSTVLSQAQNQNVQAVYAI